MCVQGQAAAKVMSPVEMAEYEEKKLKMRKAMGENLHDDVQGTVSQVNIAYLCHVPSLLA